MCGIAGYVRHDGQPADRHVIARMTATLAHRGPDGDGLLVSGPVALGHRRLAILDHARGVQPMANEDDSIHVTYNGEIYNEPSIREWLLTRGHTYRTTCDTESLVHHYEEQGADFVRELDGMFALALWDAPRNRLILARDPMGQKPLYYAELPGGGLAFASEPKALLEHPDVPRRLDPAGLARYLFYEYVPSPGTIWTGIHKLPHAHVLIWEAGHSRVVRYWSPPAPITEADAEPFPEAASRFWTEFRDAVSAHRRSDVPIGVFLSGGLDSSSVAAALAEVEPAQSIRTFSIGFEDRSFDESPYFDAVAKHLGTDHHERTFSVQHVLDLLPEVAAWLDEPFGDASILPTHLLSRFAREQVKVVLGGDGADELLAGYPTFRAEAPARLYRRMPRLARALTARAVARLPVNHRNFSLDFKLKQFVRGAGQPPALAHQRWLGSFAGPEIAALLVDPPAINVEAEHLDRASAIAASLPHADPLTQSLWMYQDTYLPEDILTKVDRASMACGLEVRAPFLGRSLVESMERLPSSYKLRGSTGKRILRQAVAGKLPPVILSRSKKGFGIPVARWLRGPLAGLLDSQLAPDRLARQGLFRPQAVQKLVSDHRDGRRDNRKPLWTLLMFQLWSNHWLDHAT
jgi:asparagine synthase (glutamine-hydrolysing)